MKIRDAVHTYDITDTLRAWGERIVIQIEKFPMYFLFVLMFFNTLCLCVCAVSSWMLAIFSWMTKLNRATNDRESQTLFSEFVAR